jgi:hypothetical protein
MNGAHGELLTFCLYANYFEKLSKTGQLAPLKLCTYQDVNGEASSPHIFLYGDFGEKRIVLQISYRAAATRPLPEFPSGVIQKNLSRTVPRGKFTDIRDIKKEMFQRLEVQSKTGSILDPAGLDLAILFTMRIRSNASELLDQC